jgi:hypothetical protein
VRREAGGRNPPGVRLRNKRISSLQETANGDNTFEEF